MTGGERTAARTDQPVLVDAAQRRVLLLQPGSVAAGQLQRINCLTANSRIRTLALRSCAAATMAAAARNSGGYRKQYVSESLARQMCGGAVASHMVLTMATARAPSCSGAPGMVRATPKNWYGRSTLKSKPGSVSGDKWMHRGHRW